MTNRKVFATEIQDIKEPFKLTQTIPLKILGRGMKRHVRLVFTISLSGKFLAQKSEEFVGYL